MIRVAQCWDDGAATDLRLIEILRKYNARATFNLCPGMMREETVPAGWADPLARCCGFSGGRIGKKDLISGENDESSGFKGSGCRRLCRGK